MTRSAAISLVVGLAAAGLLVAANDPAEILRILLQAGWGILLVLALHLPQVVLSAAGWGVLITGPGRPGLAALSYLRWVSESVNNLLPVAQVGGEVVRARLAMRRGVGGLVAAASLVVDLAVELAAQIAFAVVGLLVLAWLPQGGGIWTGGFGWVAVGGTLLGGAMAVGFMAAQRWGMFRLVERILPRLAGRIGGVPGDAAGLHDAVVRIYAEPGRLWLSGAAHLGSWLFGAVEIWAALHVLGAECSLAEALVVESLGHVMRSMGFLIPGALGVQEGGFVLVCALLGIPAEQAIALSLLRRLRDILLGLPGLLAWRWDAAAGERAAAPSAEARGLP